MTIYLTLLVAILGLVGYLIAKDERYRELGRMSFFAGLLSFLLRLQTTVSLLR